MIAWHRCLLAAALLASPLLQAAERNDLPSCYERADIADFRQPLSGRLLTVIIDQTVPMPEDVQRSAWGQIDRFVQPGDSVRLYSFSAITAGEHIRLLFSGALDTPLPEAIRDDVSMMKLRSFDRCMKGQREQYNASFGRQFVGALRGASSDHPRSEIMFSLREVANDLATQNNPEQLVFIISDMLEHSASTSFYAGGSMRNLDARREMENAQRHNLFAQFRDARIYVTGGGLATDNNRHGDRSGQAMDKLEGFWRSYFEQSGSQLAGFGKPVLNTELH